MIVTKLWAPIKIQRPVATQDAVGQPLTSWEDVLFTYADARHLRGMETLKADSPTGTVKASFRIRYKGSLDNTMRVLFNGSAYNILAVLPQGRREVVDLACERVGA
jgi:SPP1 family predicted phage head-tail adaptor